MLNSGDSKSMINTVGFYKKIDFIAANIPVKGMQPSLYP